MAGIGRQYNIGMDRHQGALLLRSHTQRRQKYRSQIWEIHLMTELEKYRIQNLQIGRQQNIGMGRSKSWVWNTAEEAGVWNRSVQLHLLLILNNKQNLKNYLSNRFCSLEIFLAQIGSQYNIGMGPNHSSYSPAQPGLHTANNLSFSSNRRFFVVDKFDRENNSKLMSE